MIIPVFLILSIIHFSYSYDNTSSIFDRINVINKSAFESRQSRLLSFATLDDKIAVELSFTVPFLSIPTKKTWSMAQGSMANINVGSLVLTGGLVAGVTLIMPLLLGIFNKKNTYPYLQNEEHYRDDKEHSEHWKYMEFIENIFSNMNATTCMQKFLCNIISESSRNLKSGKASSTDKIVDGIINSQWVINHLQDTFMYPALQNGLEEKNCLEIYTNCNIPEDSIRSAMSLFQSIFLGI